MLEGEGSGIVPALNGSGPGSATCRAWEAGGEALTRQRLLFARFAGEGDTEPGSGSPRLGFESACDRDFDCACVPEGD
jgi:hypothetical protein